MQFSRSFLGGIKKFLYSLERYFHIVLKTDLYISFSTTQSVVIAKRLESEVISRYLYFELNNCFPTVVRLSDCNQTAADATIDISTSVY